MLGHPGAELLLADGEGLPVAHPGGAAQRLAEHAERGSDPQPESPRPIHISGWSRAPPGGSSGRRSAGRAHRRGSLSWAALQRHTVRKASWTSRDLPVPGGPQSLRFTAWALGPSTDSTYMALRWRSPGRGRRTPWWRRGGCAGPMPVGALAVEVKPAAPRCVEAGVEEPGGHVVEGDGVLRAEAPRSSREAGGAVGGLADPHPPVTAARPVASARVRPGTAAWKASAQRAAWAAWSAAMQVVQAMVASADPSASRSKRRPGPRRCPRILRSATPA